MKSKTNTAPNPGKVRMSQTLKMGVTALIVALGTTTLGAQASAQLIPDGMELVRWQGGWRSGGSDPHRECTNYLQNTYPGARFQIVNTGEDARWTGWHGRHREYRYWCTAIVQPI